MPGQGKRRRRQRESAERDAARFAPGAGRWVVCFETQDYAQWREHLRRLRRSEPGIDWTAVRLDTFCGREAGPTTYRLSRFVPHAGPSAGPSAERGAGPRAG